MHWRHSTDHDLGSGMNIVEEPKYRNRNFVFRDRIHAAELLAGKLEKYASIRTLLLAIPSGGVPIGYTIARKLDIAFDMMVVRKIQIPWNTEAGFGAVTWEGDAILNEPLIASLRLPAEAIEQGIRQTREIVCARLKRFRGNRPFPDLKAKTVIVVDDGLASGFTMLAAAKSIRRCNPRRTIVAVPTASIGAIELLEDNVDELICLNIREGSVFAVADAYLNWHDLSDEEVMGYLDKMGSQWDIKSP